MVMKGRLMYQEYQLQTAKSAYRPYREGGEGAGSGRGPVKDHFA